MILEREQINRYLRHILMQEIGGAGQKKLLNSSVLVYCEDFHHSRFMFYYLAAMGIGRIICLTANTIGMDGLLDNLKSLNPDVDFSTAEPLDEEIRYDAVITFNSIQEASVLLETAPEAPIIMTAVKGDTCFIRTALNDSMLEKAVEELKGYQNNDWMKESLLYFPGSCLVGALAATEAVKAILGIGKCFVNPLYIDLTDYCFSDNPISLKPSLYSREGLSDILKDAKVLIVGSGGLGSPAAYILAGMGIGKLGLVDFDTVDISNLNRQILHSTDRIGMPKVKSAEIFLSSLNPNVKIFAYEEKFSIENAESLIKDYDIIIDGLDNLPTRYLLNDACYFQNKPLVEAGVLGFNGLATAIIPNQGPCYRCTFPEVSDTSTIPSCSETGVLGAVPGVMGVLEAVEVIKQLTGMGDSFLNKLLMFDAFNADFTVLEIYKEASCKLCGSNPSIDGLREYGFQCKDK